MELLPRSKRLARLANISLFPVLRKRSLRGPDLQLVAYLYVILLAIHFLYYYFIIIVLLLLLFLFLFLFFCNL